MERGRVVKGNTLGYQILCALFKGMGLGVR